MRVLMNTTNYDFGQIKSKMDIAYPHRQRIVRKRRPIKEIVELYPALSVTNLLSNRKYILSVRSVTKNVFAQFHSFIYFFN